MSYNQAFLTRRISSPFLIPVHETGSLSLAYLLSQAYFKEKLDLLNLCCYCCCCPPERHAKVMISIREEDTYTIYLPELLMCNKPKANRFHQA